MSDNTHNTIGPSRKTVHAGQPEVSWDVLAGDGQECVGQIEAEYGDAPGYAATRQSRYVVTGYKVWWYDSDREGVFQVKAHGTARKALAAAKAYAKGTTKAIRQGVVS